MSTFVEIRPIVHATLRTTIIRLDDDFKVTVRQEEQGETPKHFQRNYSNVVEGQQIDGADPVKYVRVTKLNDEARCVIAVDVYHAADEADTVPAAGMYWYDTKQQYAFGAPADPTKSGGEAADPSFPAGATQTFPTTIFNISTTTGTTAFPTGNTITAAATHAAQRLYARLGSLAERRNHLKQMIRNIITHRDFAIWMVNADIDGSANARNSLELIGNLIARPQSFVIWLEMMANVISLDVNLNSERKFNLLNGELGLGGYNVFTKPLTATYGTATIRAARSDRTQWPFYRFGSVATGTPWTYTDPVETSGKWQSFVRDTTIVLTGATLGNDWIDWVRS